MSMVFFLFPTLMGLLLAVIARKAGFGMGMMVLSFLPVLGIALPAIVVSLVKAGVMGLSFPILAASPVAGEVIRLVPFVLLAVLAWPVAAAAR